MTITNLDPLLQALAPGAFWVIIAAIGAVLAVILYDAGWHAGVWVAGIPERRRKRDLDQLRQIIRDWQHGDD